MVQLTENAAIFGACASPTCSVGACWVILVAADGVAVLDGCGVAVGAPVISGVAESIAFGVADGAAGVVAAQALNRTNVKVSSKDFIFMP